MLYQLRHLGALLGIAVALVVGVLLHDAAQTLTAQAAGDRTPRQQGRLTPRLGPHLDPFGAVAAVLLGWGWGSAVPMDERWRARRGRLALALAAGPATYLLLTVLAALALAPIAASPTQLLTEFPGRFCAALAYTWGALFVVSLLPVPPLDGGRIVLALAPPSVGWQKARYQLEERNIGLIVALVVLLLPLLFPRAPDVVGQLMPALLDGIGSLVGQPSLGLLADAVRQS